jgi:hypothetical protein
LKRTLLLIPPAFGHRNRTPNEMLVVSLLVLSVLAGCVPGAAALRLPSVRPSSTMVAAPTGPKKVAEGKAFLLAAVCSASLLAGAPHQALAAPTLNEAIVEVSQTSYPILKALTAETFVPFSAKIGKLLLDIAPEKLGKSIDLGVDAFLSVPPEKLAVLNSVVKDSFAGLEAASCTLVPLPSAETANKFKDVAAASVDAWSSESAAFPVPQRAAPAARDARPQA